MSNPSKAIDAGDFWLNLWVVHTFIAISLGVLSEPRSFASMLAIAPIVASLYCLVRWWRVER